MAAHLETFIEGELVTDTTRYLNRELSWLDFNARVLSLADRPDTPQNRSTNFIASTPAPSSVRCSSINL